MMRRWLAITLLAGFVFGSVGCAGSRGGGGWVHLGDRTVHGRQDRDVIAVTAREGTFRKIKIVVKGSALEMHNVVVTFGNGEKFSPPTRLVFGKRSQSRTIDLPGGARVIRKVAFRYSNLPGGGRARVRLFGR